MIFGPNCGSLDLPLKTACNDETHYWHVKICQCVTDNKPWPILIWTMVPRVVPGRTIARMRGGYKYPNNSLPDNHCQQLMLHQSRKNPVIWKNAIHSSIPRPDRII